MFIYHWRIDTANFSFDVYGATAEECVATARAAWSKHRRQTGASYRFEDVAANEPRKVRLGSAWRDDSEFIRTGRDG